MYEINFSTRTKKDFKNVNKAEIQFIYDSLYKFVHNFSSEYEIDLMKTGKIKKLQGTKDEIYRLKLRSYRVIYKKDNGRLIILVVHVTTREGAYK
jgi:mRNA interferase RelE/StbE